MFYISMLKKYIPNPSHKVDYKELEIKDNMSYIEKLVMILDRKGTMLRTKIIPMVKFLWKSHRLEEDTWELEFDMKRKYLELFE